MGAGISGDFEICYEGACVTVQTANLIAGRVADVESQLKQKLGGDFASVTVNWEGDCNEGYEIQIDWTETGDYSSVTVDATNLVASKGLLQKIFPNLYDIFQFLLDFSENIDIFVSKIRCSSSNQ